MKIPCLEDNDSSNHTETVAEDQVSLLEESITPRHNLPPLLLKLSERKPESLDWIGKLWLTFRYLSLKFYFLRSK